MRIRRGSAADFREGALSDCVTFPEFPLWLAAGNTFPPLPAAAAPEVLLGGMSSEGYREELTSLKVPSDAPNRDHDQQNVPEPAAE